METKGMLPTDEVLALPGDLRDLNQSTIWTSSKKCEGLESQVRIDLKHSIQILELN